MRQSISDLAIILSRIDYAEKDRILTVLTAKHGKLRAIAKSVRTGKSRLAGGIELFAENELGLVEGRGDLYTVTFSRMKNYYGTIAEDLDKSMYVYECLKTINKLAPDGTGGDYYDPLKKLLQALDDGAVPLGQAKIWYGLKMLESLGASPNFKTDTKGKRLNPQSNFQYDFDRHCFFEQPNGPFTPDHIKILRHLAEAAKPARIDNANDSLIDRTEQLVGQLFRGQTN